MSVYRGPEVPFPLKEALAKVAFLADTTRADAKTASRIVQVDLVRLDTPIPSFLIVAVGDFKAGNWTLPELTRSTNINKPADGIYDLTMVASQAKPSETREATRLTAVAMWTDATDVQGVRIHAEGGAMVSMLKPAAR